MMCETHWTGLSRPFWEREMDLQLSSYEILHYWAGIPNQRRQTNRLYRRLRTGDAQRKLSRSDDEGFLAFGYGWLRSARMLTSPLQRHGSSQ